MRKPIIVSSILSIVFFILSFLFYPLILSEVLEMFWLEFGKTMIITSTGLSEEVSLNINSSFAFACIPLLSLLLFILIRQTKNENYSLSRLFVVIPVLLVAYTAGCIWKVRAIAGLAHFPTSAGTKNSIPLDSFYFYDYGFVGAFIGAFLIYLFARRKRVSPGPDLLDK